MSSSNPPNPNTPPVFNNDAFNFSTGDIDTAYLNANYLRFPTAQGAENLQATNHLGLANFTGGINQTDSNYINTTISTAASTTMSGGAVISSQGSFSSSLISQSLSIGDNSTSIDQMFIDKNQILYENDTGNASQLLIASYVTDNPILIQSNGGTAYGGGITMETTQAGAPILIQAVSTLSPAIPANIQLITCNSLSVGGQSSIIMETDVVFVKNGAMRFMNNPSSYTTGLLIYEITANNFAITNSSGSLQLGSNIVMNGTTTTISNPLTPTYSGSAPTATQIGYTINTNLSGTAVLPPTANVAANMNAGIVIPNGIWFVSIIAEVNYTAVGATTSYFALSLSQSTGNMDAQNRCDFVAGLRTGDIFFNFPLIVNSTGGTYFIVGVQQGGTKTLDSLNYKITRIA